MDQPTDNMTNAQEASYQHLLIQGFTFYSMGHDKVFMRSEKEVATIYQDGTVKKEVR